LITFIHLQRILVIDEDVEMMFAIIRHLRRNGFMMDSAFGNEEAKQKINDAEISGKPIGLVIRIVNSHRTECIEFVNWIHGQHGTTSIIIISGLGNMDWITPLMIPGKDAAAQNPLTPEKLLDIIGELEHGKQLRGGTFPACKWNEQTITT
jgi:DNA-binding NtrC family response regulator